MGTDGANVLSYDSVENKNALTIKSLGDNKKTGSNHEMFKKYYGRHDFADHWVQSAFEGVETNFDNGNANFGKYSIIGKIEAIKKGTAYISALQYMFHELEEAVSECEETTRDGHAHDNALECWDEGVAYYVGSLQGSKLTAGGGKFPYVLADKRCSNFKTCNAAAPFTTGTVSWVNHNVMAKFHMGKNALVKGDCYMAQTALDQISKLVYIPLIQGTLRYAYKVEFLQNGNADDLEKEQAEGTVFAAAVLPVIYDKDKKAAGTIYDHMKLGAKQTVFSEVKKAFERVYDDLSINCANVGCLIESGPNTCYEGADACATRCKDNNSKDPEKQVYVPGMNLNTLTCGELANISAQYRNAYCATQNVTEACPGTCLGTCVCFDDPNECKTTWEDKKWKKLCKKDKDLEAKCPDTCKGWCDPVPFTKKFKEIKKENEKKSLKGK